MVACTLRIGDLIVLTAAGGLPEVEYVLFDPGDIELRTTEPRAIREVGYRTTAGEARRRLAAAGLTVAEAAAAAAAARTHIAPAYARGAAVRCVTSELDAVELFEGHTFDPARGGYVGRWLDLPRLAGDLGDTMHAACTLQALHLTALLAERGDEEPVVLETAEVTALGRSGERTYKRAALGDPAAVARALSMLRTLVDRNGDTEGPARREVLDALRGRAVLGGIAQERLERAEGLLDARERPARGPLSDPALWDLERKLARGDAEGVIEAMDALEKQRGRGPGTLYLRARLALTNASEEARAVAERVSGLYNSMTDFHELALLAAQAWALAGDARRARAFARELLTNGGACDGLRAHAMDVLAAVEPTAAGAAGGAPPAPSAPVSVPIPTVRSSLAPAGSPAPAPPASAVTPAAPPSIGSRASAPSAPAVQSIRPRSSTVSMPAAPSIRPRTAFPPGGSRPALSIEPRIERATSRPPVEVIGPERAESLADPAGLGGASPAEGEKPRSPDAARRMCTSLARELGRELRATRGIELRTDADGLEVAQRYLREAISDDPPGRSSRDSRPIQPEREVMRVGAFLSEVLARRLGARWVDLEADAPGRWAMVVPSRTRPEEVARVWPIGRALRFAQMAHKERDLVSYYLELEGRAR